MKMQQVRAMARELGVKAGRATKADLIRAIQRAEGSFDCFGTAEAGICDQTHCLWREACFRQTRR